MSRKFASAASLRRDIGAPDVRHLVVVNAGDQETALAASEKIAVVLRQSIAQGYLKSFESPARYLPASRHSTRVRRRCPSPRSCAQICKKRSAACRFAPACSNLF